MPHLDPVTLAIPLFIALILAEMAWARRARREAYEPADTRTSLLLGLGSTVSGALFAAAILALATWLYAHRLVTLAPDPLATWWLWPLAFVLDDFNYYWAHRTGHRVRWFWASHVNHHSSQHYNLSTALRQTWTGPFALSFLFRVWPALIGFPPAMLIAVGGVNLVYQFWIHTEAVGRLPRWFEAVMNTPSHHRVHHATNPAYLDRNYAGVFIVWDRLFASFTPERDDPAIGRIRYGLVHQLGRFDVLHSVFHEWRAIARDIAAAPWRHKLSYLLREPGWSHDGASETSAQIRARWEARN